MADNSKKRTAPNDAENRRAGKRNKSRKAYLAKAHGHTTVDTIEAGISGIFASCEKGKEARCVTDLYNLFEKFSEKLYGTSVARSGDVKDNVENKHEEEETDSEDDGDIEKALQRDIAAFKKPEKPTEEKLFSSVKLSSPCLIFFRFKAPCNPVEMVDAICEAAWSKPDDMPYQRVQRLSPVALTGKATLPALTETATTVLAPHFHQEQKGIKFAIQPTIRNHSTMTRDEIIRTVATCVGLGHSVDLKNYDLLILVNIYKNSCGVSVVKNFEKYRKFSISQIIEYRRKEGNAEDANSKKRSE